MKRVFKIACMTFNGRRQTATNALELEADIALARSLGVTGTPGFFVNGRFLSGAQPYAAFKQKIDAELQKDS